MKNLSILLFAILLVFASCSSDDDNSNDQIDLTVDITGSWELTSLEYEGESTIEVENQTLTISFDGFGKDFDAQVNFTEDPNEVTSTGSYTLVLTTNFMGESITQEQFVDFSDDSITGEWSIENGNQLVVVSNGETQTAEIISLNESKMVLLTNESTTIDGVNVIISSEMTLER
ncbi:MAG: lipocalin family protein [Flavobacteriaceae bacterium]